MPIPGYIWNTIYCDEGIMRARVVFHITLMYLLWDKLQRLIESRSQIFSRT